ncbi:MAG: type I glutamate--ammonia ligase [Candidatus Hadarchaeales archaeon]
MKEEITRVLERVEKEKIKFIQLQFTDILGGVKNITIPAPKLEKSFEEGIFFDGSSVLGYATIEESDMRLIPDPRTLVVLPWITEEEHKTASLICGVYDHEGNRAPGDPRAALERVMEEARKMGWVFHTAPEYEFFLFSTDSAGNPTANPSDAGGYFDLMRDRSDFVRREIVNYLQAMGLEVEASHHEVAPGQHEIDLRHTDALASADHVALMKYVTKVVAQKHGLFASFMPKPIFGVNGSGMHVHQSLLTLDGKNAFYDPKGPYKLSKLALHFIAGLLEHAKETCAVFSSTVNSYKRLVPGYEAPVYISWANRNRSAYIRVPAGRGMRTRVELRSPDPAGNPYLQFAVMLAAGLDGIKRKLEPPEPIEKDLYHMSPSERKALKVEFLPDSLGSALEYLKRSQLVRETLGDHLFEHFLFIKEKEWETYRAQVSDWEIRNLLPIL